MFYYQWYSCRKFGEIFRAISFADLKSLYHTLHEADISKFVDIVDAKMKEYYPETRLKSFRSTNGLSQNELARVSGVNSRSIEMMKAAKKAINEVNPETKLIAVTVLTSSDQNVLDNELMIDGNINDVILKYASNTKEAGLDGVVCSPLESKIIKEKCGEDFLTVTPGIRFADDAKGDQKRVTTPAMAKEIGSSYIVVGRSITGAKDPVEAYRRCVREFIGE